jgi:hypothetical protein
MFSLDGSYRGHYSVVMPKDREFSTRLSLGATPELIALIDDWRRRLPSIPTRAAAARMMIEATAARDGVTAAPTKAKRKGKTGGN